MTGTITEKQYDALHETAWHRYKNRAPFRYGYIWTRWKNQFWLQYQRRAHLTAYCRETKAYVLQLVGPYLNHGQPVSFFLKIVEEELARRARHEDPQP